MNHDDEPTSNALRDLRRAHKRQRYEGDLGSLAEPARRRSPWPALAAAALLAICGLIGWQAALLLKQSEPIAREAQSPPIERAPQVHTLELTEPPPESLATESPRERRPVLPGMLVMHSPRATPPPRPSFAPRPSLSHIQSNITSDEQGPPP